MDRRRFLAVLGLSPALPFVPLPKPQYSYKFCPSLEVYCWQFRENGYSELEMSGSDWIYSYVEPHEFIKVRQIT